jgi:hypothetical protein
MAIVDTDEGTLRISFSDASETNKRFIMDAQSEQLDLSTDPRQQVIIPKTADFLEEDDKIIFEYGALAATTIDYSATEAFTKFRIPITVMNKRTGAIYEKFLRHPDISSADVTISTANVFTRIGTYTVGAQEKVKLGHKIIDASRAYVVLGETGSS